MDTHHDRMDQGIGARPGGVPQWVGLMPVGIVTLGALSRPVERNIGMQSAVYRLIRALGNVRIPRRSDGAARGETRRPVPVRG